VTNGSDASPESPSRSALDFAERFFSATRGGGADPVANAVLAFQRLHECLRSVIGQGGWDVLFRRSLSKAAVRHAILEDLREEATLEAIVAALQRPAHDDAGEIVAALRDIMAEQLSVLAQFIGEDLLKAILHTGQDECPEPRAGDEAQRDE
jgi:hypothetical protein